MRKFREWLNIQLIRHPSRMVLGAILLFNVLFFFGAAFVISRFALTGTEYMSFIEAAFCTITMILDAGCIQFVVADIGTARVAIVVVCLAIVLIGMISFTGAVIGYITSYISNFVENANASSKRLRISDHAVILNWNTRASEIINDLLYCDTRQKVVVLTGERRTEIEREISERLNDTYAKENAAVAQACKEMSFIGKRLYAWRHKFRNRITVIVREGDVFSSKQLNDISLGRAKMVIILGDERGRSMAKEEKKGNPQTVKTLMQVADIVSAESSDDNQRIIVEISDSWTAELVNKIISAKQVEGKCNIVPVNVNQVLGHILSQFSLMPELNIAYRDLFSNKGSAFYAKPLEVENEDEYIKNFFNTNNRAIPLSSMICNGQSYFYYVAGREKDIEKTCTVEKTDYKVKLDSNYWIEPKNVIILGHNSRCEEIMNGFELFCGEWGYKDRDKSIVRVLVIDDKAHLEKVDYYKKYPFVIETVAADIYEKELICSTIDSFVSSNEEDTSVLILSDDSATGENMDANALANLVYVQDIINTKKATIPDFDEESIDVIVEITDPKHYDVVNSYSVNNVVISNRYISKMITQLGEKDAMFEFYTDILTYDDVEAGRTDSKEIYIKKVSSFFEELPERTTAGELVRAVYEASVDGKIDNPSILLGYVRPGGKMVLFGADQYSEAVELGKKDKLVLYSSH